MRHQKPYADPAGPVLIGLGCGAVTACYHGVWLGLVVMIVSAITSIYLLPKI